MPRRLVNPGIEKKRLAFFQRVFCITATFQARTSYFLMSFHAVNPGILQSLCNSDPHKYLFMNMVYGFSLMLYSRPSMIPLSTFHRIMFSVMGSLMFNQSSMFVYSWLKEMLQEKPILLTCLSVLSGRIMLLHLLAYLYHVDSRCRLFRMRLNHEYEDMYRETM